MYQMNPCINYEFCWPAKERNGMGTQYSPYLEPITDHIWNQLLDMGSGSVQISAAK